MTVPNATLFSVRPRYAGALLSGAKTVEIRAGRVRIPAGSLIVLYATAPVCAVLGSTRVACIDTASPGVVWRRWGAHTGLQRSEFDAYTGGSGLVSALLMRDASRLATPIALADLRWRLPGFSVPQRYRSLAEREMCALRQSGVFDGDEPQASRTRADHETSAIK